jgi:hypothetical protein
VEAGVEALLHASAKGLVEELFGKLESVGAPGVADQHGGLGVHQVAVEDAHFRPVAAPRGCAGRANGATGGGGQQLAAARVERRIGFVAAPGL